MKILVTNDDGINAVGIKLLVEKARKYGEVVVVAPKVNQSATSHRINIKEGFSVEKVDLFDGIKSYAVDSTPADCVRYAYYHLKEDFDIVFSGINDGFNLGFDMLYSGTVAGAMEASYYGKKGIAFSVDFHTLTGANKYFDEVMKYIFDNKLLEKGDLFNINFPENSKGIIITRQGDTHFDTYFENKEGRYYQKGKARHHLEKNNIEGDVYALMNDYVSITPMTSDRTNISLYNILKNKE